MATTNHEDMIDLKWQEPADHGGGTIIWYCINVAGIDGTFTAPTADPQCMNTDLATDTALETDAETPVDTPYAERVER